MPQTDQLEDEAASEPSETEMEEQLCAQAAEAFNHVVRSHHIAASTEVARNRLKSSLYMIEQQRRRKNYPISADAIALEAMQGCRAQTSEEPVTVNKQDYLTVHFQLSKPSIMIYKRALLLPNVQPIPIMKTWTALTKNYEVEDEILLETTDVVTAFYENKQQRTSQCEIEFTQELSERVLQTLQSTWDLTFSDLKRVANVIEIEKEVIIAVHSRLRQAQQTAKKKRKKVAISTTTNSILPQSITLTPLEKSTSLLMERCMEQYEQSIDSFRSIFCRRCCVYDCDYHGCLEQPKLRIVEQNAVASNQKAALINKGRNCGNQCFLGQTTTQAPLISTTVDSDQRAPLLARLYCLCFGNFCEMAKIFSHKTCLEVAELCASYGLTDRILPSTRRPQSKSRRSRKRKNARMSTYHLQNSQNGVVNAIQIKIKPCSHEGPCESSTCSCVEDGLFCSKHCHCVHNDCKIFFRGCQCQRGRCRTKACPCYCAGRECDIDVCKLCCAEEIAAHMKGIAYDGSTRSDVACQNRSMSLSKQKHVRMGRSSQNASTWGLFVDEFVGKDEFIIEYIGEMVTQEEADRRGAVYDEVDRSYLFNLDTKTVIDSTRKGNKTRFINHSSELPNCACKIMNVSSDFRIGLFAIQDLQPHTELFFDYGYVKALDHEEELVSAKETET